MTSVDAAGNAAVQQTRSVTVGEAPDTTPPVITLSGGSVTLDFGQAFVDPGFSATDNLDGNITASVVRSGLPNVNVAGPYTVTYNVVDAAGNAAVQQTRSVTVGEAPDTTPPVITLSGGSVTLDFGQAFVDPGFSATDNLDGNITASVVRGGLPNVNVAGPYTVTYNVVDAAGNAAVQQTRSVTVGEAPDTTPPVITLSGGSVALDFGQAFVDPGFSATDNLDGNITASVVRSGLPNVNVAGSYTVTYNVVDAAIRERGRTANKERDRGPRK